MKHLLILALTTVCVATLVGAAVPKIAHADGDSADVINNLDDKETFDVGEILVTSHQDNSYFEADENVSPVEAFILDIINFIMRIVGVVAMLLIIVGGIMMIVAQGEEHLLQKGKDTIIAAVFGIAIVMFSYIIVRFVQSLFYLDSPSL